MRILVFSDLHIDNNYNFGGKNILPNLINFINKHKPDIVLIAGDIAGGAKQAIKYLETIEQETNIKIYFIPGNHDVWTYTDNSMNEYNMLKNHYTSLIDKPVLLNEEFVLIGDMGWYDYSFGLSTFNEENFNQWKPEITKDSLYAKWEKSDKEVCSLMISKFREQLETYKDKKVILVNHFIPYIDFVSFKNDLKWSIGNGFMGSNKLGELIDEYPNIKYAIFGHTHKRYGTVEFGNLNVICNPFGYSGDWKTTDTDTEIESASTFINI